MMNSTERDSKFVAGLAAQGPWLHVPKMMRVGRLATAEQAGLLGNIAKMRFVAIAAGGAQGEHALIDPLGSRILDAPGLSSTAILADCGVQIFDARSFTGIVARALAASGR